MGNDRTGTTGMRRRKRPDIKGIVEEEKQSTPPQKQEQKEAPTQKKAAENCDEPLLQEAPLLNPNFLKNWKDSIDKF